MAQADGLDGPDVDEGFGRGSTREQFLKRAGATGLAIGMGGTLAGCFGGDDDSASSATGTAAEAQNVRQGGNMRIGLASGSPADTVTPWVSHSTGDAARQFAIYNALTQIRGAEKTLEPEYHLAEEMEPNAKGDVWTIRLREGVEFHNGKTLDVDDLIFTHSRITDPKEGAFVYARWLLFDMKAAKKLDNRTLRIPLTQPTAILRELMAGGSLTNIVPVGFDPKKPVGTGPFKLKSFAPGRQTVLERFENFWGDPNGPVGGPGGPAKVDQLTLVALVDETARYNALLSGQIDVMDGVPFAQLEALKANPDFVFSSVPSSQWYPIYVRVDKAPFDDVRVRQALRLSADRQQVIATAYHGEATIGNDVFAKFDPLQDMSLKRDQDLEQARSLLKQAGAEGATATLTTSQVGPGAVEACQILAENAKAAGFNLKLNQIDLGTMYGPNYGKWPFAIDVWPGVNYLVLMASNSISTAFLNQPHFRDKEYDSLYQQAIAELDEAKRKELAAELQRIDFERGGNLILAHPNYTAAYSKNVGGFYPTNLTGGAVAAGYYNNLGFVA